MKLASVERRNLLFADSRKTIQTVALSERSRCSGLRDSNFSADFH